MRPSLRTWGHLTLTMLAMSCKSSSTSSPASGGANGPRADIHASGSATLGPLMKAWSDAYPRVNPSVHVVYDAAGSGAGLRALMARQVSFGTVDSPLTDEQMKAAPSPVVHIPLAMGAVVPIYNLPGLAHTLRFTGDVLAGIYLGDIKVWNDPKIAAVNPYVDLPNTPISVVHRADGSGVTYKLTDYFSKVSPAWKSKFGPVFELAWPVGVGGRQDDGVATAVKQTEGSIGYTELSYALQHDLAVAEMKNQSGNFIEPTIAAVTAAAVGEIPEDLRYSLADASPPEAWPISGTSWALVYGDMPNGPERTATVAFLHWAVHDGQKMTERLGYAPLPPELLNRIDGKLKLVDLGK